MLFKSAFQLIMEKRGYSQRALAEQVGVKQPSIARTLSVGNPPMTMLQKYLDAMGYDLAFVPKGTRLPDGSYVITREDQ